MPTLPEIDEALTHAQAVPQAERGAAWVAYVDSLLEQRRGLAGNDAPLFSNREVRVLVAPETR